MSPRLPLRWRVALAHGLIGLVLSVGFALATTFIAEDYEHLLIGALLEGQGQDYAARLAEDPQAALPTSSRYSAYREQDAPAEFRGQATGIHEIHLPGRKGLHFAVFGEPGQRLVMVIDVGEIEALERYLAQIMLAIIAGGTLFSGWVGWVLARRTVAPVARLAEAVRGLPVQAAPTHLADEFSPDELGQLAAAIDAYQGRLADASSAERTFFSNANHELRTPITVIQGAIEVMRDDAALVASQHVRLDRVDRAVMELGVLLEALLLAARGVPAERDSIPLRQAFTDALAKVEGSHRAAADRLQVVVEGEPEVQAPRRWLDSILVVLIQRVLSRGPAKRWQATLSEQGIMFNESGGAGQVDQRVARSDLGLGLMFVERLCRDLGWQLQQGEDADARLCIVLRTTPTHAA
ncbi:sensor histidine kinase [Arenimonas alkanexedens]